MNKKLLLAVVLVIALMAVISSVTFAQETDVEPNDTCQTAEDIGTVTLPFTLPGSLDGSPLPDGDVDFFGFSGTPNASLLVDLEGSSTGKGTLGDPYLGFFDSGCNLVALDDDAGEGLNSRLQITVPGDGVFTLAVTRCCDGGFNQGGSGSYKLTVQEFLPPVNDDFVDAIVIGALSFSDDADTTGATLEAGEPTPSCTLSYNPGRTIWYAFTPGTSGSISARFDFTNFSPFIAAYTGNGLAYLNEVGCREYGGMMTIQVNQGTTYFFQVGGLFGEGGLMRFVLELTPLPIANFGFYPGDPSIFDTVQFYDYSFDPGEVGIEMQQWDFGDGGIATGCCPTHQCVADGDYTVQLTVTTFDDRSATTSQVVQVRTHDVAITKIDAPNSASSGQTRRTSVNIRNHRYPERVRVELFKSVPQGFEFVGSSEQTVPVRKGNRTTNFAFNYTFTDQDASIGKVTFKAVAYLQDTRDALPADNEAIATPTKVTSKGRPYGASLSNTADTSSAGTLLGVLGLGTFAGLVLIVGTPPQWRKWRNR